MNIPPDIMTAGWPRGLLYEGPYWSAKRRSLWWVDIVGKAVFCRDEHGSIRQYHMPEKVSAVVETADDRLLLTGQKRLLALEPDSGHYVVAFELNEEPAGNRCNDAKCDPFGNLWFGSMDDAEEASTGALWCLTRSGQVHRFFGGVGISNTLAWDIERQRMYFGDSRLGTIFTMNYRVVDGIPELGPKELFAGPDVAVGIPDGSAVDAEGNLWNARWDGGCVICLNPDGRLIQTIDVGAKRPTSCAFAGVRLDTLVVTTASLGLKELAFDALDGHVLAFPVITPGQAVAHYGGTILPKYSPAAMELP